MNKESEKKRVNPDPAIAVPCDGNDRHVAHQQVRDKKWRYLLSTMALLAGVLLALWFVLLQLIRMGAVLPADTGARNLERTTVLLQAQETFDPGEIPFYYRWALADSSGILESNLSPKEETWAQKVLAGEVSRHGFLYTKYYWAAYNIITISYQIRLLNTFTCWTSSRIIRCVSPIYIYFFPILYYTNSNNFFTHTGHSYTAYIRTIITCSCNHN